MNGEELLPLFNNEKKGINYFRGVLVVSFGFFGLFLAFNAAQGLASSGDIKGLGEASFGCVYAAFALIAVFAPKIVRRLGPKTAMILGGSPYILLVMSNLKPGWLTTIPCSILTGLGAGLLWTAQAIYLGRCALWHSIKTSEDSEATTSHFNGVFFTFFQFNGMTGALLSSIILTSGSGDTVLYVVLAVSAAIGLIILSFTQRVSKPPELDEATGDVSLIKTLYLLVEDKRMLLIVPMIFFNGMSLSFMFGDYTGDLVKPTLGKSYVGFVLAVFYGINAICSYANGRIAGTRVGRRGVCIGACITTVLFFIAVLMFNPTVPVAHDDKLKTAILLFVFAGVFAIGDSVWESQLIAILQNFHSNDDDRNAAMANQKMWQSLGFATQFLIGYISSNTSPSVQVRRMNFKCWILLGVFAFAAICLFILNKISPFDTKHGKTSSNKTTDANEINSESDSLLLNTTAVVPPSPSSSYQSRSQETDNGSSASGSSYLPPQVDDVIGESMTHNSNDEMPQVEVDNDKLEMKNELESNDDYLLTM
eukprot:TRINITY_DN16172_c0_g1_i1.p1 TRINITY_DN16172_c0_g1~~TRINITY_DN16172_c0_g1_i1.p1  ORF type:complete len:536 (-),score=129.74 TRINITY_DN16172_c0_g1_i1:221-1828(-)